MSISNIGSFGGYVNKNSVFFMCFFGVLSVSVVWYKLSMTEKIKKTLYLPEWIVELLIAEEDSSGGQGIAAAAAIYDFCRKERLSKKKILQEFAVQDIESTYGCAGSPNPPATRHEAAETARQIVQRATQKARKAGPRKKTARRKPKSG